MTNWTIEGAQHQKNKNWWIWHKSAFLMNPQDPKYQLKSKAVSSAEPNHFVHFAMRHPVAWYISSWGKNIAKPEQIRQLFSLIMVFLTNLSKNNFNFVNLLCLKWITWSNSQQQTVWKDVDLPGLLHFYFGLPRSTAPARVHK